MAFVGISSNLLHRVRHKIKTMQAAEINTLGNQPKVTVSPDNLVVMQALWKEHLHLKNLIPSDWKKTTDSIQARFAIKVDEETTKDFRYTVHFGKEIEAPITYGYYQVYFLDTTVPELSEIYSYATKHAEVDARWEKVSTKVVHYLESCKSLNEAVKTWPDVKLYIDKEDLDRLEVKREKQVKSSAATEALANMNVDELVGAAVIARMSGAA